MNKKIKKGDNFLKLIPKKNLKYQWIEKEDGRIQIIIPRDKILDKIVRKIFKTPESFKIDLDKIGSFIFKNIDGKNNIEKIAELLKKQFGQEVEPLYKRLITYINILRNNKFITLERRGK
ncbi:PqqD family protein [Garciella nitratireducens]|uniref:PqqD family protein n=1 Tax=Garciella nitratireducens TaxID=218205 RepID=UPI001BD4809E|nr:PqqD family protein [Garciella nitratireducens]